MLDICCEFTLIWDQYGSSKAMKNHHRHSCNYSIFYADFKNITSSKINRPFEIFSKNLFLNSMQPIYQMCSGINSQVSAKKTKKKVEDAE